MPDLVGKDVDAVVKAIFGPPANDVDAFVDSLVKKVWDTFIVTPTDLLERLEAATDQQYADDAATVSAPDFVL